MSGSLFQGQVIPPQPTGSDVSSNYPAWLQQYVYNLANAGTNLASQDFSQFPGPQIASPSASTQMAWGMAGDNIGAWRPALQNAEDRTQAAAAPLSASTINSYMNPYTNNVIGALQQASNQNLQMNTLPAIQDKFVSAGQTRSPQEMEATNRALYLNNQALDQATAGALQQGYQGALQTATQQQGIQMQAGAQMGALGQLQQQQTGYDIGQEAAAGQGIDTYNQSNLNGALNNFYAQQQWPYQNLAFASNIVRGQPVASNTQTVGLQPASSSSYTASPLSAFIGGALGGQALANGATGTGAASGALGYQAGGSVANDNTVGALSIGARRARQSLLRAA